MKLCILCVFIVIQAMKCDQAVSKLSRNVKMNVNCLKIKCPSVEDPQCVRLRRQNDKQSFHIIAANKCELKYLKCLDDVEGKIVSMKFCGHDAGLTAEKNKNNHGSPTSPHIRPKRRAILSKPSVKPSLRQADKQKISRNNKSKHTKLRTSGANRKKQPLLWKSEYPEVMPKENRPNVHRMKGPGNQGRQSFGYPFSSETDSDIEQNEKKKLAKGISGYLVRVEDEEGSSSKPAKLQPKAFMPPNYSRPVRLKFQLGQKRARPTFSLFSTESIISLNKSLGDVDMKQYVETCPKVCPSRDVMVCGKCQHGIHRTFSSVCHLRMFACNHAEETITLLSRMPCVLSSPFLSEKGMQPQGRVVEPGDDDIVLRFIKCRDQGQLGEDQKPSDGRRTMATFREDYTYDEKQQSFYKFHESARSWLEAKQVCNEEGASFFYPETSAEVHTVISQFWKSDAKNALIKHIFVGISETKTKRISNLRTDRVFMTIDGKHISKVYEKWGPSVPINNIGKECVQMNQEAEYNDVDCDIHLAFICKQSARPLDTTNKHNNKNIVNHSLKDPRCNFGTANGNLKFFDFKGTNVLLDKQLLTTQNTEENSEY